MVLIETDPSQFTEYNFTLKKEVILINRDDNDGLGFTIIGGIDYPYFPGHNGIFIVSVRPNTVVGRDGRLKGGDLIHSVNGKSLHNIKHCNAVQILKNIKPGPVVFEVTFNAEKCILLQLKQTIIPGKGVFKNRSSLCSEVLRRNTNLTNTNKMTAVVENQNTENLFNYTSKYKNELDRYDETDDTGISDNETDNTSTKNNYTPYLRHRFISSSSSIYGKNNYNKSSTPYEYMNFDDDDMLERASTVSYTPSVVGNFHDDNCITITETPRRKRTFSLNDNDNLTDDDIIPYSEYVAAVVGVGAAVTASVFVYKYFFKK
uniref:PDZ domain-containing protein n=1 Tax=Strongyloides stercoralis TaxID=6248 RepID=A0A0K0DUL7_STRER